MYHYIMKSDPISAIHQLEVLHVDAAYGIVDRARKDMQSRGIDQWYDGYPSKEMVIEDIRKKEMLGYIYKNNLEGIITVNEFQDPKYGSITWRYNGKKTGVFHRLTVDPIFQGLGIAKKLILAGEDYFRKRGINQIRLDAYSNNPAALHLYDSLLYERNGEVSYPFRANSFHLFEKELKYPDGF